MRRYLSTANITLNFLAGVDGLKYANIVQGASNSIEFLRFFAEASQTVDPNTLRPVLEEFYKSASMRVMRAKERAMQAVRVM